MTYEATKRENTRNAAPAALKLLQHFAKTIGHRMSDKEQQAVALLIDKATCNGDFDLMSEEFFNSLVTPIVYH